VKVLEKAQAIYNKILVAFMVLAGVIVVADSLAISIDVFRRASFGEMWTGLFELTEYSLVWMTFLGTTWLLKNGSHINVDMIINRLSPRARAVTNIATSIIGVILLGIVTWYCAKLTLHDYQAATALPSVLRLPKWPVEIVIPIGTFLLFIQFLLNTYGHLKSWSAMSKRLEAQSGGELGGKR
jgi:TRAP-type C4-dicarboxylate transport system permease small subunit